MAYVEMSTKNGGMFRDLTGSSADKDTAKTDILAGTLPTAPGSTFTVEGTSITQYYWTGSDWQVI